MSALFALLVAASAFFAAFSLFEAPVKRALPKAARWTAKSRYSLRARLRRAG